MTEELVRELDLFEYETKGDQKVVSKVADQSGWKFVKETLLKNVGMNSVPVIRIEDADFGHKHTLYLVHDHDGRDLHLAYAEKCLFYLSQLWNGEVVLETSLNGSKYMLIYDENGYSSKPAP
jgi:stage V sporulation protein R